ncbi:MAG TPA: hypothetical protein VG122_11880 [Gemmata sp.]|jgi:hypothetical protein|nr:hypothetical protein [Gemmata sp.]
MFALFAQVARNQNNNAGFPPRDELLLVLGIVGAIVLIWLIVAILFLLSLSKTLSYCRPRNRTMEPGQVWLNLIPIFNIVWHFITVIRVAESIRKEFRSRGWSTREDFGQTLGIVTSVMFLVGSCFALIGLICFILYWAKIAGYSSQLAAREEYDEYEDDRWDDEDDDRRYDKDEDDDDDDRPWERRRRRR